MHAADDYASGRLPDARGRYRFIMRYAIIGIISRESPIFLHAGNLPPLVKQPPVPLEPAMGTAAANTGPFANLAGVGAAVGQSPVAARHYLRLGWSRCRAGTLISMLQI